MSANAEKRGRARGDGCIFRPRGCRLWYIRYVGVKERVTRNGRKTKIITESSGSTKRSVAAQMLRDRLGRKDKGEQIVNPQRVKFDDLVQLITDDYTTNGRKSLERVEDSLAHLKKFFGGSRAINVAARWPRYIAERQAEKAANQTINNERSAVHRMFVLAKRVSLVAEVPYLVKLEVDNVRERVLDDEDVANILKELPEDIRGAIEFGAYTGWRVKSEVLPLTWDRVDLERGVIRWEVGTTKNKAGRVLILRTLPNLKALVERWRRITDAAEAKLHRRIPWVFHRDGRPILKKRFYKVWHDACAKAEVLDAIPHDLRRAAVMRFERDGVPRKAAMSVTGHKTESIYGRYNIVREVEQEEALAKVKLPTF